MFNMSIEDSLLSNLVVYRTYAKYLPEHSRRESLSEAINRNMEMHIDHFPKLTDEIVNAFRLVHQGAVMPSMRGLQFGGIAINQNHIRQYNCSFHNINRIAAFAETFYLLLCGAGVGYSVQRHHINCLPPIQKPRESMYYMIHDSIEGWTMALQGLMDAYFSRKPLPAFDFSFIRDEGSLLKTTGGRAPGPSKLKIMLEQVESKLKQAIGRRLHPIEVHDTLCMIAECVRAGGIREAALIVLFDRDDDEMLKCKSGTWWEQYPYRGRANNSAVLPRDEVTYDEFFSIFNILKNNRTGEPAFYWTNNKYEWGANPCVEIALRHLQFCNLTTINQTTAQSEKDLLERVNAAAFIGTLQAAYTDFPFLDYQWKQITEQEALIGVSFTGIADTGNRVSPTMLTMAAREAVKKNRDTAKLLGINCAARVTTGKPEGSSSATLGTSSGLHSRKGKTYLRRVRLKNNTPLVQFLLDQVPELMEKSLREDDNMIITIPQRAPDGALLMEEESALDVFSRAMQYNISWVRPGHVSGDNYNNMSCTIDVREHEWDSIGENMWLQRSLYNGISLLPYDGGTYVQAPFEVCDQSTYQRYLSLVKPLDFTKIKEYVDITEQKIQAACGGGACEVY